MNRTHHTLTILVLFLVASAAPSRAESAADALTKGKLQHDLGNYGIAAELFARASTDAAATDPVRWESLTRLGLTKRRLNDQAGALQAFQELVRRYGQEPDAQRFIVHNVMGLTLTDAHWRLVQPRFHVEAVEPPGYGASLRTDWGAGTESCSAPGKPAELSLDFLDALMGDVFRFFKDFSGVPFEVDPCVNDMLITIRLSRQPWDAALRTIAGAYGLSCSYEEGRGMRIACGPNSPTPAMTERLVVDGAEAAKPGAATR